MGESKRRKHEIVRRNRSVWRNVIFFAKPAEANKGLGHTHRMMVKGGKRVDEQGVKKMAESLQRLKVGGTRRHLVREEGSAFFWLGDTAWELFHRLTVEEAEHYLRTRAEQRFTVVQAVALAEFSGVTTGNAYGRLPFHLGDRGLPDPTRPDTDGSYSYWDHVDTVVRKAGEYGLYVAFLPTWGDKFNKGWGVGPEIFTPENAYTYGKWLGERYRDVPHLIWVLGGDRAMHTRRHMEIVRRMAEGLKDGDGGGHLMTYHPQGQDSSSRQLHDEPWLDFNMIQSGHSDAHVSNDLRVLEDYGREPVKPVLDAEPCYEDHPIGFKPENGYYDAADVRKAAYYAILSGALGHTYGHHSVWSMADAPYASTELKEPGNYIVMNWRDALRRPGAEQMRHLRAFAEKYGPHFAPDACLLAGNFPGSNRQVAARSNRAAAVYTPTGPYVDLVADTKGFDAEAASWYDPRTGEERPATSVVIGDIRRYPTPSAGRGEDWVLIVPTASA